MGASRLIAAAATGLLLLACSDQDVGLRNIAPRVPADGLIHGQVCDDIKQVWLEGATVYTHLYDDDGFIYDTVTDVTDAEGRFQLAVPSGLPYDLYISHGNKIVQSFQVIMPLGETVLELPAPACFGDVDLTVAVITGAYDDLGGLFQALGLATWRDVDGTDRDELVDFLSDPAILAEYQVIFFDAGHIEEHVIYPIGQPVVDVIHENLRTYVQNGGSVFAGDWAYDVVEQVWPDKVDFLGDDTIPDAAQAGEPGDVQAEIFDDLMATAVPVPFVNITYDLSVFPVVEATDPTTRVYLTADVPYRLGFNLQVMEASPVALSFYDGLGQVYFTTYRSAVNGEGDMLDVLRFLLSAFE